MRSVVLRSLAMAIFALACQIVVFGQTGSISGTVSDANGGLVPSASIEIRGDGGQKYSVVTNNSGTYTVPAVASGMYTVAVSASGFKKVIVENVKVDTGIPATVNAVLEAGQVSETIVVTGGGEVLQTQTATVGTTITGRQITETPIASRDALDLVSLLPGTATVGRPRSASINGLPKGALSISIDGVDVQDNVLRSSDGYFTYVRPRVDAIEEVTVSTATPGAESSGDGAVQIKFVTRRGTNDYNGGVFWQHRDEGLNANYWYANRDGRRDDNGKAYRQKIRLNQYGARYGGPIPYPRFGDGGGSWFKSGKDDLFFFANYEEFRQPESYLRTRTVLTPLLQSGVYSYVSGGTTRTVDLYQIAAANNQLSTVDPTVANVLSRIRSAVGSTGTLTPTSDPNFQTFSFQPEGSQKRTFLALRFDANITKQHSAEVILNLQKFYPGTDFLNGVEERYPGFPAYGQGSKRNSTALALRSTLTQSIVNELRYAQSYGDSSFFDTITAADFDYMGGRLIDISALATSPVALNSKSARSTPTYDLTNNMTWIKGSHTFNFGGQYKIIRSLGSAMNRIVPTVSFGIDSTEGTIYRMFDSTSMPGSTAAQQAAARSAYATLIGHVLGYATTAYLGPDGVYQENGESIRRAKQTTYGLYAQDQWKIKPGLTVNFGLRWQPQTPWIAKSAGNYTRLENWEQVYGISGAGNLFKPGTMSGSVPRVVALEIGEAATPADYNNFAPSVGFVWSPNFKEGLLRSFFGGAGKGVIRGGYSMAFVREGANLLESINGANPGGSLSMSRNTGTPVGSFVFGTNLRDPNNPNIRPNNSFTLAPGGAPIIGSAPPFPITLNSSNATNAFHPDLKTGAVHSFNFGYQRELDRNTVVELRYVGNRGVDLQRQHNINEFNTIENGFADEFKLAQQNLYANIAAGRGASFAYAGAGTGTVPLPIMMSYFNGASTFDPNNPARYSPGFFANATLVNYLSVLNPSVGAFGSTMENSAARRANALANGRPANFFYVNPTTPGNSYIVDNSNKTWYDSGVIELRRRLSDGLRLQANYVFSKARSNAYASSSVVYADFTQRPGGLDLARNIQAFDLTHQFKVDATYEVPFGRGRWIGRDMNRWADAIVGGWTISPTIRWQSGSPVSFGNVQLVGMTAKELQKMIGVYKNTMIEFPGTAPIQRVTFLPWDVILNTVKAFDINVANVANGGYGTNYGPGGPQGRYIAPAGTGNCMSRYAGECGFNNLILYGPSFFKFDTSIQKSFKFGERRDVQLRLTALDVLNAPNFRIGGWAADTVGMSYGSAFGQMGSGSAYQDLSTTNDPGGRIIDLMIRVNF